MQGSIGPTLSPMRSGQAVDPLDLVRDSVITRDAHGLILTWNRAAETIYGWPADAALGRNIDTLLGTDPASVAAMGSGDWAGIVQRRHRDGREISIDVRLSHHTRDNDIAAIETGQDLSSQRQADDQRAYSDQRYYSLFRAVAASFWELDTTAVNDMVVQLAQTGVTDFGRYFAEHPDYVRRLTQATRILDVNQQTADLFGNGDKAEFAGSIDTFWPDESLPVYINALLADLADQPNFIAETRFRKLDGAVFDGLFTCAFPPPRNGHRTIMVGVVDLTDRKRAYAEMERSERRYRGLFRHTPIALCQLDESALVPLYEDWERAGLTDLAGHLEANPELLIHLLDNLLVADANEHALALFGASAIGDLLGPVARFWPLALPTVRRAFAARYSGERSFQEEARLVTIDGRTIDVLFGANYQKDEHQQRQIVLSFVDIGDRIKAQNAYNRIQTDFAHAARVSMLGELTASIAHEVNQPLGAIVANGQAGQRWLTRAEPNIEQALRSTVNMVADARRAADIIGRIRAMATNQAPRREMLDLNSLVNEVILFLSHEMVSRDVRPVLDLAPALPSSHVDRTQVQQVLANLCVNAMQAMTQAGTTGKSLRIATARSDTDGVVCIVEDSGSGIAPDHLDRLFESFFTTKDTGMGMGLPICRSIVEAHGGMISADNASSLGGARFIFSLPAGGQSDP